MFILVSLILYIVNVAQFPSAEEVKTMMGGGTSTETQVTIDYFTLFLSLVVGIVLPALTLVGALKKTKALKAEAGK